ncbi:MAG: hypothetical protein IPL25_14790 [Saprospiraceae bacterium]|nr:hypothetical protein [Candidatus Vicinibacter affinis]
MDPTPMIKTILFFGLLFWSINLLGQKQETFFIHGGPSITNVQEIINGEKHFFASPERPYYSIRYHFGICVEENIFSKEYLGVKYGLNFDKRASSTPPLTNTMRISKGLLAFHYKLHISH